MTVEEMAILERELVSVEKRAQEAAKQINALQPLSCEAIVAILLEVFLPTLEELSS